MDKLERPQKRIKVKASKNDSTLTALATNVSSMGNQFDKAINQISNTVHHSVDAVRQMNRILESMLEKSVDIHVRVTRCRVCVGQVNICVDVCNKSPLPLVRGGLLKVELMPNFLPFLTMTLSAKFQYLETRSRKPQTGKLK